jgi:hypothetical protein
MTPTPLNTATVLLGAADDIETYLHNPGVLLLVADRLRRYVANELDDTQVRIR